ncbi:type I restriction enzyme S subunit [Zymomonas mobilis]|uniref:Type I restriction modification DNA specificity domain-containing protein n=1 Tax=Zymomonas mobilis subsp. mobilis TaxID=120045 RepID=A0A1Z1NE21_ZYMMB|nr:restriction endonuclease subunit S [Zymomonas mobilis]ARW77709.1 hypothetical protein B9T50_09100 [Zymomonas mobilis subsp. mobilis]TWD58313.1 type I restriction enzyme S subunit [Zymomonas mobilis]TWD58340.1 type I restriction enzyme S subunit [Zymomonas mobilis]
MNTPISTNFLPIGWSKKRLFDLCQFIPGKAHELFIDPFGEYICVNSKFISTEGQVAKTCNQNISPAKKNDILLVMSDLPKGRALAKCYLVQEDNRFAVNQRVCILRPRTECDPRMLFQLLNRNAYFLSFDDGVNQTHLLNSVFEKCELIVPNDYTEQNHIGKALSDADALIEGLARLIAKKQLIKQGAMQDLLTGRHRLPGFSREWVDYTIQDIASVDPEALGAGTATNRIINYISLENVSRGVLNGWNETSFRDAPSRARRILRQHDVLLGTVRPNLQSHLLFDQKGDNWIGSTGFAVLRARLELCSPRYLFELIMSHVIGRQIDELIAGSNYPAISNREIRTLQIALPSLNEQNAISTILSDMDTEIQAFETCLEKARQVKEGMMQNLLTGRIRLV